MQAFWNSKFMKDLNRFLYIVDRHNIFILSSSLAYYAALALAPFLLIVFSVTKLVGVESQQRLVRQIGFTISPQVGDIVKLIVENIDKAVDTTSLTGLLGICIILFTSSVVFLHLRYSFNLIFNFYDPERTRSFFDLIKERVISMGFVVVFNIGFVASLFITPNYHFLVQLFFIITS